jgi:hypothetical protein
LGKFLIHYLIGFIGLAACAGVALWYFYPQRPKGLKFHHFEYVYIENDGTAREVTKDELVYLKTKFSLFDGGRPYIKSSYEARTPDGRMQGFLLRSMVPSNILIQGESVIVES